MTSEAARPSAQPARIDVPDQLQQSRRPPAPRPDAAVSPRGPKREAEATPAPREGILGQLERERAHD